MNVNICSGIFCSAIVFLSTLMDVRENLKKFAINPFDTPRHRNLLFLCLREITTNWNCAQLFTKPPFLCCFFFFLFYSNSRRNEFPMTIFFRDFFCVFHFLREIHIKFFFASLPSLSRILNLLPYSERQLTTLLTRDLIDCELDHQLDLENLMLFAFDTKQLMCGWEMLLGIFN